MESEAAFQDVAVQWRIGKGEWCDFVFRPDPIPVDFEMLFFCAGPFQLPSGGGSELLP